MLKLYLDSVLSTTFEVFKIEPKLSKYTKITLIQPKGCRVSVSEMRLWSVSLPQIILKENFKVPLAMLYEQKRAIKIKIKKKNDASSPL